MNKKMARITWLLTGLVLACFLPLTTHAQAETGAQEHATSNTAPIAIPPSKTDFEGHFSLPFQVQCHGHKLVPGEYTLVAIEDGWTLDWAKPEVIAHYLPKGQKVTIPAHRKDTALPEAVEVQAK